MGGRARMASVHEWPSAKRKIDWTGQSSGAGSNRHSRKPVVLAVAGDDVLPLAWKAVWGVDAVEVA
jgi:hypothetical protein